MEPMERTVVQGPKVLLGPQAPGDSQESVVRTESPEALDSPVPPGPQVLQGGRARVEIQAMTVHQDLQVLLVYLASWVPSAPKVKLDPVAPKVPWALLEPRANPGQGAYPVTLSW